MRNAHISEMRSKDDGIFIKYGKEYLGPGGTLACQLRVYIYNSINQSPIILKEKHILNHFKHFKPP